MKAGEGFHDLSSMRSPGQPMGWIGISMMAAAAVCVALSLSGCVNLFSGVDHPSGDAQLISAARACLDAGDYQCAMNDYQQLSSAQSDIAYSEEAYAVFAQNGASMEAFAEGFGNGSNTNFGTGFTAMANSIIATGVPGATIRTAIYNAFIKYQSITDNTGLSALVEFLGATAFASEVLAEMANGASSLTCTELESGSNPVTTCATGGSLGTCYDSHMTCGTPISGAGSGTATLDMFNAAMLNIQDGIERLGGSGTLASLFNSAFSFGDFSLSDSACSGLTPPEFLEVLEQLQIGGCSS